MHIQLNGHISEYPDNLTLSALIENLSLHKKRFAIEVNQEIIPGSSFSAYHLQDGDIVEIVNAIGGG